VEERPARERALSEAVGGEGLARAQVSEEQDPAHGRRRQRELRVRTRERLVEVTPVWRAFRWKDDSRAIRVTHGERTTERRADRAIEGHHLDVVVAGSARDRRARAAISPASSFRIEIDESMSTTTAAPFGGLAEARRCRDAPCTRTRVGREGDGGERPVEGRAEALGLSWTSSSRDATTDVPVRTPTPFTRTASSDPQR